MSIGNLSWEELSATVKAVIMGGGILVTATLGWARMDHQKADRVDVERNARAIQAQDALLRQMNERQIQMDQRLQRLICRQYPQDMGC